MSILMLSAYLFQMAATQQVSIDWCSSVVDSNQNARAIDDSQNYQPLATMQGQAMSLLSSRNFLKLSTRQLRTIGNINVVRGYYYYLVRASIMSRIDSDISERRERLNNSHKIILYDPIRRILNLHIAQMYNEQNGLYVQMPLIIRTSVRVDTYNLFCHSAA